MTLEIISGWHFLKVNYKLLSPTMIHIATVVFMQQLTSLEISERDLLFLVTEMIYLFNKRSLSVRIISIMFHYFEYDLSMSLTKTNTL